MLAFGRMLIYVVEMR